MSTERTDFVCQAINVLMESEGVHEVEVEYVDADDTPSWARGYVCRGCKNVHIVVQQHRLWDLDEARDRTLRRITGAPPNDLPLSEAPDPQPKGGPNGRDARSDCEG